MEINLVLAPEQSPATLLEMQAAHPQNFFYLGKVSQLSGTNLLIVGEPALVQQFKRPMPFNSRVINGQLQGNFIHQIAFQSKEHNDELIGQLVSANAILAQSADGESEYMLWTFWPDQATLVEFLESDTYKQMQRLMRNAYTTTYAHVMSEDHLSLMHKKDDDNNQTQGV